MGTIMKTALFSVLPHETLKRFEKTKDKSLLRNEFLLFRLTNGTLLLEQIQEKKNERILE